MISTSYHSLAGEPEFVKFYFGSIQLQFNSEFGAMVNIALEIVKFNELC